MTDVSTQSLNSGWSSFVLILATTIPLILVWKPLRYFINEYRLYKRCQQYPNIVVYKGNSSASASERKSDDGIVGLVMLIGIWLFRALLSFLRFVMDSFITLLTSAINKKEKERSNAEETPTPLSSSKEITDYTVTSSSDIGNQPQLPSRRSIRHSIPMEARNNGAKVQRAQTGKQNFIVMRQSEEIFESSNQQTEKVDQPMQNGLHSMASAPAMQERPRSILRKRERSSANSRPSKHHSQTQMVATTSTLATVPKPFVFDSSSLSEKMRKRRLNGENIMGYNAITTGEGDEGISRKRRKLNVGRMPLQGCVARHPRAGAWQTTKILDKREREEREERLLRSMSRKRVKRTEETSKLAAPGTASTVAPAASTPAFTFGQTAAPTAKQETPATVSTPVPAFQFGGNTVAKPKEGESGGAEKKPEPATKAPAVSFGNTTTATTTTAATSDKAQAPAPSASAASFQFGAPSADTKPKDRPAQQQPPTFGVAPASTSTSAAPSAPAAAATSFGAPLVAPPASSFGAPSVPAAAAPTFGAPSAAPPAPSFGGFSAASAAPTQAPAPSTFGAPSAPTTFGAAPSQPAKPAAAAPFSFGNTKENTNPGGFNSKFQAAAPSNGFIKPQVPNAPTSGFGGSNFGGMPVGFSAGAAPPAATNGASARRMARRARSRRR